MRGRAVVSHVFGIEGGHSNDPADRGGETQYGISLRFLIAHGHIDANRDGLIDLDLNLDTVIDGRDVRELAKHPDKAVGIYLDYFWVPKPPAFWALPRPFDGALFDQAVNGGTTAAIKILQRALNAQFRTLFGLEPLTADGVLGAKTRERLALAVERDPVAALQRYRDAASDRYRAIAKADSSQAKYLGGWLARAARLGNV